MARKRSPEGRPIKPGDIVLLYGRETGALLVFVEQASKRSIRGGWARLEPELGRTLPLFRDGAFKFKLSSVVVVGRALGRQDSRRHNEERLLERLDKVGQKLLKQMEACDGQKKKS